MEAINQVLVAYLYCLFVCYHERFYMSTTISLKGIVKWYKGFQKKRKNKKGNRSSKYYSDLWDKKLRGLR